MSSPRVRVRSRRKTITVAVTGAATPVGDHIVRALLERSTAGSAIGTVVGLGAERGAAEVDRPRANELAIAGAGRRPIDKRRES